MFVSYPFVTLRNRMILKIGDKVKPDSSIQFASLMLEEAGGVFTFYKGFSVEIKKYAFTIGVISIFGSIMAYTLFKFMGKEKRKAMMNDTLNYVEYKVHQKADVYIDD